MNTKDFLIGTLIGGFVGAAAALLLAPKSGKELRSDISEQASIAKEKTTKFTATAYEKGSEIASKAKEKSASIAKTVSEQSGKVASKVKEVTKNITSDVKALKATGEQAVEEDELEEVVEEVQAEVVSTVEEK